ncbi:MAG TPA: hypothetical protein VLT87_05405, partial [Thermoanaerobaculia bacterium]|nr:hypothetical protein [Thermoanaerobaculia bacterium]
MTERIQNPELDRLVQELNNGNAAPGALVGTEPVLAFEPPSAAQVEASLDRPAQAQVGEGEPLDRLLAELVRQGASDMLLIAGMPPVLRINGRLTRLEAAPLDGDEISRMFQ